MCQEPPECTAANGRAAPLGACKCSGQGAPTNPIGVEVIDQVWIPADIPAGDYVLGANANGALVQTFPLLHTLTVCAS